MLAISILMMLASGGLTWLAAALWVMQAARRTGMTSAATIGAKDRAIVVLGHRLDPDAAPSGAFRARLGRAVGLWRAAPARRILVLGGPSRPEQPSEAEVGRAVLIAQGVPDGCIHSEIRSRHTLENLRSLRGALAADQGTPTLVTSRPHLARAALMARGMRIGCEPCAAEPRLDAAGLAAIPREAFLLHWYVTGRTVAWLLNSQRLASRVT